MANRLNQRRMGFGVDLGGNEQGAAELFEQVHPEDLIKYGMIPEFVGRLPVVATLEDLDEGALVQILTEPKNAITKQYKKIFEYEDVSLRFTEGALHEIAKIALEKEIGARGLRQIIEDLMLDIMYQIPSLPQTEDLVISRDVVERRVQPLTGVRKKVS